jgi:hypothetical protein
VFLQTHDGQEVDDDAPYGIYMAESGTGINNQTYAEEFSPTYNE